uniref:NADH dehydrogenase subunit 2 n=1 Tax=Cissites auriculata TaxID=1288037 RepID=UPI001FA77E3A|nr:NADH dehydrogenase subunit 2 [Cissites auriculata]UMR54834.1 NADH dehydrogenase subunit 2 [Cissites auriculata]
MAKLYKILFMNSLVLGTIISVSSYSWFSMWMGLEINLLSFIPLMSSTNNMYSSEASLKYFVSQAMASIILLFSVILIFMSTEFITPMVNSYVMMLNSALFMKLGAAPFHFWFPEVMEGLDWVNCSILLTWQKIAPFILISNNKPSSLFLLFIIMTSLLISTIMSFNQISLRKIMAFSSINHIAWMTAAMMTNNSIWLIYLCIYIVITINMTLIFYQNKLFFINQIPGLFSINKNLKFTFMINFLSLGGLPPFLGFLPKWLTISSLMNDNFGFTTIILILLTLIMLFVYIRIIMTSLIFSYMESKLTNSNMTSFTQFPINFLTISSLISCTILFNFL